MRFTAEAVGAARDLRLDPRIVVNDDAVDRFDRRTPRRSIEHPLRVLVAGLPASADAGGREINVLRVILAVERSDFPIIKAVTVYVAVATMVINLLADLLYKAIDPRVVLK